MYLPYFQHFESGVTQHAMPLPQLFFPLTFFLGIWYLLWMKNKANAIRKKDT
jgi:hypothetical protein